ncbi:MAG: DUF5519 family protein [Solirubrobacteraceae bacterium]|nr:DUF5519 family protein [Solirubrobacteraceae bacterium]
MPVADPAASPDGPNSLITATLLTWADVTVGTGSRGEWSFRVGRREIGHLHGDRVAHFGFPKKVWHRLYDEGRIDFHPVFPGKPGFAQRVIASEHDAMDVIELMRENYDRAMSKVRPD